MPTAQRQFGVVILIQIGGERNGRAGSSGLARLHTIRGLARGQGSPRAAAIPVEVIGNLLRLPNEDRGSLRDWSLAILGALERLVTAEQRFTGDRAVREFTERVPVCRLHASKRRSQFSGWCGGSPICGWMACLCAASVRASGDFARYRSV